MCVSISLPLSHGCNKNTSEHRWRCDSPTPNLPIYARKEAHGASSKAQTPASDSSKRKKCFSFMCILLHVKNAHRPNLSLLMQKKILSDSTECRCRQTTRLRGPGAGAGRAAPRPEPPGTGHSSAFLTWVQAAALCLQRRSLTGISAAPRSVE